MFSRTGLALLGLAAIGLLVLLPPPALVLGPPAATVTSPAMFEELEKRLMTALQRHDQGALEELLADDYELTSMDVAGGRLGKVGYVQRALRSDTPGIDDFRFRSLSASPLSDELVMVRMEVDWRSGPAGSQAERRSLVTDLWRLRDGRWQVVSRHATHAR